MALAQVVGIELDRRDGVFGADEPISGNVVVRVSEPCRASRLEVGLGVVCSQKTRDQFTAAQREAIAEETLADRPEWSTAGDHRHPFTLQPSGRVRSYEGVAMDLRPVVRARLYPQRRVEQPIAVQPQRDTDFELEWDEGPLRPSRYRWLAVTGLLAAASAAFVAFAAVRGAYGLMSIPIIALVVFGGAVVYGLPGYMARLKIGPAAVELARSDDERNRLQVAVRSAPGAALPAPPRARLVVRERVKRGQSDSTHVWKTDLYADDAALEPIDTGYWRAALRLPDPGTVPYDFFVGQLGTGTGKSYYAVDWELTVTVELARWPDWKKVVPIHASPAEAPTPTVGRGAT